MARDTQILISGKTVFYIIVGFICLASPWLLLTDFYYIPFALVLGLAFMALVFYSPFIGLLIYTFFFLIRPQEWVGILQAVPMPMERPLALLLLVSVLIRAILQGRVKFKLYPVDTGLLILIGTVLAGVIFAIRVDESWQEFQDIAKLAILHFLVAAVIQDRRELKWFLLYVIALTAFYSFWSVWGYYNGVRQWRMGIDRAVGPDTSYGAPNSLAMTLVSTIPLVYYYLTRQTPSWLRLWIYGVLALMMWNVILTGSRTGMAGLLFFFFLLMWQSKYKLRMMLVSAVALVCIWFVMPEQYRQRFESTTEVTPTEDDRTGAAMSASARIEGIKIGLQMLADRPLLGFGVGNWGYTSGTYYRPGWWGNAHTIIGQIFGEIGLLGLIAFLIWLYTLFTAMARLRRFYLTRNDQFMANTALALRAMLVLLLVLGLGGHNMFRYSWFLISALVAAMLKVQRQELLEEQQGSEHSQEPATSVHQETAGL